MHPSLSKGERKRYAGFDPDKWYPWNDEISAEFTDLMRRSPRDTSFARGLTYVAQRAVPEGRYIPTKQLLENLARLPSAFRAANGSGYQATIDRPGHAFVAYTGMPGFSNVCIAIQGELTQRLLASGAQGVVVKHAASCRVNGDGSCQFEIQWTGESPPADAQPVKLEELLAGTPEVATEPVTPADSKVAGRAEAASASEAPEPPARTAATPATVAAAAAEELPEGMSSDDLFVQLRKRLAEADEHARRYSQAQAEVDRLRVDLSRMQAQAQADVAKAEKERDEALEALEALRRRVREIVSDD